jgi:hypothetical protein
VIPPIFVPHTSGLPFPSEYRGCDVPNIDLDTMAHPGDPMIPGSWTGMHVDQLLLNGMQWLDGQHPEIDIPIGLREYWTA